MSRSFLIY